MRSRLNWYIYVLQTLHDAIVANFILSHRASLGFLDIKSKHYLDGKKNSQAQSQKTLQNPGCEIILIPGFLKKQIESNKILPNRTELNKMK